MGEVISNIDETQERHQFQIKTTTESQFTTKYTKYDTVKQISTHTRWIWFGFCGHCFKIDTKQ